MTPNTQAPLRAMPIPNDRLLMDLAPRRFLKPVDLTDRWQVEFITVIVTRFMDCETIPVASDIDPQTRKPRIVVKPAMYFKFSEESKEWEVPMLIGAQANVDALISATRGRTTGDAIGKRVTIEIGTHKRAKVLRISPIAVMSNAGPAVKSTQGNPTPTIGKIEPKLNVNDLKNKTVSQLRQEIVDYPGHGSGIYWYQWSKVMVAHNSASKTEPKFSQADGAKIVADQGNDFLKAFDYLTLAYGHLLKQPASV